MSQVGSGWLGFSWVAVVAVVVAVVAVVVAVVVVGLGHVRTRGWLDWARVGFILFVAVCCRCLLFGCCLLLLLTLFAVCCWIGLEMG